MNLWKLAFGRRRKVSGELGRMEIRNLAMKRHWAFEPEIGHDHQGRWRAAWEINRLAWVKTTSFSSSSEAELCIYLTVGRVFGVEYSEGD